VPAWLQEPESPTVAQRSVLCRALVLSLVLLRALVLHRVPGPRRVLQACRALSADASASGAVAAALAFR